MQDDGKTPFTVLTWGPEQRITEKAENELKGDYSRILDVVRCSVIVFTEEQLQIVALTLQARKRAYKRKTPRKLDCECIVARRKNRFKTPLYRGHRDALYNIVVKCAEVDATHVCEMQLHLADLMATKNNLMCFTSIFGITFVEVGNMRSV